MDEKVSADIKRQVDLMFPLPDDGEPDATLLAARYECARQLGAAAERQRWQAITDHARKVDKYPLGLRLGQTDLTVDEVVAVIDAAPPGTASTTDIGFARELARHVHTPGHS